MDDSISSYSFEKEILVLDGMNFFVQAVTLTNEYGKKIYIIDLKTNEKQLETFTQWILKLKSTYHLMKATRAGLLSFFLTAIFTVSIVLLITGKLPFFENQEEETEGE
jgi:hypothetical protein